jgi:integrase
MFERFCAEIGRVPFPASEETLCLWISDMLLHRKKLTTVCRYVAGVAHYHVAHGAETPLTAYVRHILAGARQILSEQPRQVQPLTVDHLRAIAELLQAERSDTGARNLSIITLGFASALRRSNLAWMQMADLEFCGEQGLRIHIRREKNDRAREGRWIGVPYTRDAAICAVRSLEAWLRIRGTGDGPVYTRLDPARRGPLEPLTPNAILELVKRAARRVDPSRRWGSHSLRAGLISAAGVRNISPLIIARQSGHRNPESLARYFRPDDVFAGNVVELLGL